jgi:DNA-directed RNA polymerase subunit beta
MVTDQVDYLTADEEDRYVSRRPTRSTPRLLHRRACPRPAKGGEVEFVARRQVDYMDVSPRQMVSVATAMIPFLEHDDANRALMGANMQRQAVPLVRSDSPLVGTGMELRAAVDAGDVIITEKSGVVEEVSRRLHHGDGRRRHPARPTGCASSAAVNQGTCANQRPIVDEGAACRGPARSWPTARAPRTARWRWARTCSWRSCRGRATTTRTRSSCRSARGGGRLLTSIHIEEHEIDARDTKLGAEEITRDIPNVSEEVLADLDERGIIRIGAEVRDGDILVGKVTPKGETELTPEERLLRAIFGEKAREVRDTSLKVPHGETGKVIGIRVFSPRRRRRSASGRQRAGAGLRRPEAQDPGRRQARRPPRQQGRHRQDPARRRTCRSCPTAPRSTSS